MPLGERVFRCEACGQGMGRLHAARTLAAVAGSPSATANACAAR
jgi:hypothetical protein